MRPMEASSELKHSPLEKEHVALGAKLGPFGGWLMPIEYAGALAEHRAVRERVGLFDLTHLGKVEVAGPGALGLLQGVVTNDVSTVDVGGAQYNLVLNEGGGVIEDLIVYRLDEDRYFVVPNASNTQRVLQILGEADAPDRVHLMYHQDWCFLAVQGQRSPSIVTALFPEAGELSFMRCIESAYRRRPVIVTRSGYTGEVGFELFTYQDIAVDLWHELARCDGGRRWDAVRARSSRRAPAGDGLPALRAGSVRVLHGARGGTVVGCLAGQGAISAAERRSCGSSAEGLPSRLRGLRMHERRHIPRAHYPVFVGDRVIGEVTSGTFSPLLRDGDRPRLPLAGRRGRRGRGGRGGHPGPAGRRDRRAASVRGSQPPLEGHRRFQGPHEIPDAVPPETNVIEQPGQDPPRPR